MPRPKRQRGGRQARALREPIDPSRVYTRAELPALLRVGENYLAGEVRAGRLACRSRAGRQLFLGRWLIDWLEAADAREGESDGAAAI